MTRRQRRQGSVSAYLLLLVSGLFVFINTATAATGIASCYKGVGEGQSFDVMPDHALYILVDQTTPLSTAMKSRLTQIVSGWGNAGDHVKIVGFSANFRDQYPRLYFDGRVERQPTQEFLFNLHYKEKTTLANCLQEQQKAFNSGFNNQFAQALSDISVEIPKTDLLYSLKQISDQLVKPQDGMKRTVLLVSDGLENSSVTSFYQKGKIKILNDKKVISHVRRKGLVANWKNANVYLYGIGLWPKPSEYANVKAVSSVGRFWERYFVEGNAIIKAIGTPELLITSIR